MDVFWFIPTGGDGRYLGTTIGARPTDASYLRQLAQAIDGLGYAGALLPTSSFCEDAWIVASSLIPLTERMKFLVAVRPGYMLPSIAARMAATFDRISQGRLLINVVTGGDVPELRGDGVFLDHDTRYEVTDEFLHVWRGLMRGDTVDYKGHHLQNEGGKLLHGPVQHPYPPLYFGGSSPAGIAVAAEHADVYLTWGEPPALVAEKIAAAREAARAKGRTLRFGIRLHVIVRETEGEAWDNANRLLRYVDDKAIAKAQARLAQMDSHGERRQRSLHNGSRETLEISPNLWAGVGLVRSGVGTALVGDAAIVAERMREYAELGIDTFILSGYPHLEEAYRFAELVFPLLKTEHVETSGAFRLI